MSVFRLLRAVSFTFILLLDITPSFRKGVLVFMLIDYISTHTHPLMRANEGSDLHKDANISMMTL